MKFIALGAADSVGASCYFLQVDGLNFLLDCGKGFIGDGKKPYGPDFTSLIPRMFASLSQLDAILISHGHFLPWQGAVWLDYQRFGDHGKHRGNQDDWCLRHPR